MRLFVYILPVLLIIECSADAQTLGWNAGFDGFLDNREYFSINNPQTIFAARTWGVIGADLGENHRLRAGLNYLYEFGYEADAHTPDVTMYYHYDSEKIDFLMGSFPRRDLLYYPLALLSDTLNYFRPNVQGTYARYTGSNWSQAIFIDWTSRQTDEQPERFIIGFSGEIKKDIFFIEDHFMMAHLAGKGIPDPDFHLRDNGGFNINIGLDLSEKVFLDTLVIKAGGLVSIDRIRGVDPGWQTPAGFMGQFSAGYKFAGIHALYYRGEGHTFFYGDPFYKLNSYGRLDMYVVPLRSENLSLKVNFIMHLAKGQIDYSQQLLMSVSIN